MKSAGQITRLDCTPRVLRRRVGVLACLVVIAMTYGCSRWNWRGRGFDDKSIGWSEKMRPAADEKQFSGFDARAREIERNLGVR
jgi:hypothetical protein